MSAPLSAAAPDSPADDSARVAALIIAVGVASALHIGKLPPAIPILSTGLGLTLVQAGFLLSIIQLAGMTLGAASGLLADRLGPRRVMLGGLCLLSLGSVLGALAPGSAWLLASRAVEGMGFLLAVLPAPVLLRRQVRSAGRLQQALGFWGAYMPTGTALALLLTPLAYAWAGWRLTWGLLALLVLLCAYGVWRLVPPDPAVAEPVPRFWASMGERLRLTLSSAGPWWVALAFLMYSGQWLAVVGFLPTVYTQAGWPVAWIGPLTALAAGANLIGNIGAGRWLARGAQPFTLLGLGFVAMGAGAFLVFSGVAPVGVQYAAVLLFSAVGGLIPGTLFTLAVQFAPSSHTVSTTVGWVQQLSSLGQFASPPVVAWIAAMSGGWSATWLFNLTCCVLGLGLAAGLQAHWQRMGRRSGG